MSSEELALTCYGVEVRVADAAGAGLCQRLRDTLPPEFVTPSEPAPVSVAYSVTTTSPESAQAAPEASTEYVVACDDVAVFATDSEEDLFRWLRRDIDLCVAQRSPRLAFIHAGVVGWRGVAIVFPGRDAATSTDLVVELVRRGAIYYSDTFAALDETGRVHPYRGLPEVAGDVHPRDLRLILEDAPAEPLPLGLVVAGAYQPGSAWRPTIVRGAHSTLPLLDSMVVPRDASARLLSIATRVAPGVITLRGPRPEPSEAAAHLLDLVDEALVSHAITAVDGSSSRLANDLGRVAEIRLRSPAGRPVSPPRTLAATRFVRLPDFLSSAEHDRLLDHALAHEDEFRESGIVGNDGENKLDHETRKSRTLSGARLEEIWPMFDERLRAMLPYVRQELGLAWFPLGEVERQLTAHGRGGFFVPHVDTGHPIAATRRVSCVYYFHRTPRPFSGGELRLYDSWITPSGSTGAATCTTLTPLDNSIVMFPSNAFHEVRPVLPETDNFGDSRFTVTIWLREGAWSEASEASQPPG